MIRTLLLTLFIANAALADGLPHPLQSIAVGEVTTSKMWEDIRRPELLAQFSKHVYGQPLPKPSTVQYAVATADFDKVVRKDINIEVEGPHGKATIPLRLFIPKHTSKPPAVFLLIDHRGVTTDDPNQSSNFAPVAFLNAEGYAVAIFKTEDLAPDKWLFSRFRTKVINLFYAENDPLPPSAGKALNAWAWGAVRAMDYLQGETAVDPTKVFLVGHSRGGKAALWAGAQDRRFAMVIANESGAGGAKMARASDGESLLKLNLFYPHWFSENYRKFAVSPTELPVDQHQLISLIAPRPVYIASAAEDSNAGPRGEYLGLIGATSAYRLYGFQGLGLGPKAWPLKQDRVYHADRMAYHLRPGSHDLLLSDWIKFVVYANRFK